jgi:uncharacterized protein (DUF2147 family)
MALRHGLCAVLLAGAALLPAPRGVSALEAGIDASPVGLWQTISDTTGKPQAMVRIREINGEFVGVIEDVVDRAKRYSICRSCKDDRHDQPVWGLTIIDSVRRDGADFAGGRILEPDTGRIYSCKLTPLEGGKRLDVRGYLLGMTFLGRSQTWVRIE